MCTEFIIRHINQLAPTEIFTTRQVLIYGSRTAVDSAMSRMVGKGFIHRLANGVFVRNLSENPTLVQIVEAKIKTFAGTVLPHAKRMLARLKISTEESANTFAKNGSSSSFETIRGRAILKNQCARKMRLYEEKVGEVGIMLWQLKNCDMRDIIDALTENFNRAERENFLYSASLLPSRITKKCAYRFPFARIQLHNPFL